MNYRQLLKYLGVGFVFLVALMFFWPNLVHESMHLLALKTMGIDGTIHYDWDIGKTTPGPWITPSRQVQGYGVFWYVLAPSLFSVAMMFVLWLTRRWAGFLTHCVLPLYLGTDLIANIRGFKSPTCDFHFLVGVSGWQVMVLQLVVIVLVAYVSSKGAMSGRLFGWAKRS